MRYRNRIIKHTKLGFRISVISTRNKLFVAFYCDKILTKTKLKRKAAIGLPFLSHNLSLMLGQELKGT